MEFQEYPKALYKAGAMLLAEDEHQEADMREAGCLDWHDDQARLNEPEDDPAPTKTSRKPKA